MNASQRRLLRDLKTIKTQSKNDKQFDASPLDANNLFFWNATIFGPPETIWEGAVFKLTIEYPENYPHCAPTVKFVKKIPFHPNVYSNGKICLDMLQQQWSSAYDTYAILAAIQSLLTDPNPASPANHEAATLYKSNRAEYDLQVRQVVTSTWE